MATKPKKDKYVVSVYMRDGRVFEYDVSSPLRAREHAWKIITEGYRHTPPDTDDLEWYPPHAIDKVKVEGGAESTAYRDRVRAT